MVTADSTAPQSALRKNLTDLQAQLCIAQSGVTVATQFLKSQDAGQDWDIAHLLEHFVGERLAKQIECMDGVLSQMKEDVS